MNIKTMQRLIVGIVICSAFSLNAQTVTFNGATSNDMRLSSNYIGGILPTSSDNLIMTAAGNSLGSTISVNSLTTSGSGGLVFAGGSTLNVVGDVNFGGSSYTGFQGAGRVVIGGALNVNSRTLEILDSVNTGTNYTANGFGNLTVASGATLRLRLYSTPTGTSLTTGSLFDFSGVTFATGSNLTVSFESTYALADRTFNLFNAETLGNSGFIPTITFQGGGIGSTGSYNSTTGMYVLNAVPEPSTYLMMGLFSVILIGAAIRRKQSA